MIQQPLVTCVLRFKEIVGVMPTRDFRGNNVILKVFKKESQLSHLQQQWPLPVLKRVFISYIFYRTMLDDVRFVFLILECWGESCKLIDQAMEENNNKSPPFLYKCKWKTLHAKDIIKQISVNTRLHENGIIQIVVHDFSIHNT